LNRRDFLKGIGVGVTAAGVATVIRVANEAPELPPVPEFSSTDEVWAIIRYIDCNGPLPPVELVRKAILYAVALPDNPMALVPVSLIIRKLVYGKDPRVTSKYKSAMIGGPEFTAFIEKFNKYIS